jgi:site-specific recombinase XerD
MVLNFVCRASKMRKTGLSPIELSVIIKGERRFIATQRYCKSLDFNSKTQKVKGDKELNNYLESIKKKCWRIEMDMMGEEYNVDDFVYVYKYGKPTKTIINVYDEHNNMYSAKVLSGEVENTALYKYKQSREKMLKYCDGKDVDIKSITPAFVEGYMSWLTMRMKPSTVNKEMKMFKKILAFAVREGYITANPFHITLRETKLEYHPLTETEIRMIMEKDIDNDRIDAIRDLFIFQCYTGLSYIDMSTFGKEDIFNGVIIKNRKKTDVKSVIPILPPVQKILEKYEYQLPIISNQKYNSYLKVLGDVCGTSMILHSHLARHTYATMLLNKGVDMKTVSRTMGHSNSKITEKIYAEMRNQTVVDNILKVF